MDSLSERLTAVTADIDAAVRASGRRSSDITTIVVTKFHDADLVRQLAALGVRDVGENRHQEAQAKAEQLAGLGLRWHFVGQLQSKKAKAVRGYATAVHSLDRVSVIDALAADAELIDGFLQVNLSDDPARGGARPEDLEEVAERILSAPGIRLAGVMAVAPLGEDPRRAFARLRGYSERVTPLDPAASAISAGMSHDFAEAISEGATHLRIGTAITGLRPERR